MNATKLIIDNKKVLNLIQLWFGFFIVSFSILRYLFESPSTINIVTSILFSFQGISMIFLGSKLRKTIFEKDGDQLKIRWPHTFSKKAFSDHCIKEISRGTSYLFVKPFEGDAYRHRIDPLKPKSREALIDFLYTHFPNRLKVR